MKNNIFRKVLFGLVVWLGIAGLGYSGVNVYEHMTRPLDVKMTTFKTDFVAENFKILENDGVYVVKMKVDGGWGYLANVNSSAPVWRTRSVSHQDWRVTWSDSPVWINTAHKFSTLEEARTVVNGIAQEATTEEYEKEIHEDKWKEVK